MSTIISDLHIHCGLKGFACDGHPDYTDFTIWDYYPAQEDALDRLKGVLRAAIKDTAMASQANLDACAEAHLRVPFLAIYPIERQMFDLDPQPPFRRLFKFLLRGQQHAYLGSAVSGFPLEKVKAIIAQVTNTEGQGFNYYREYLRERAYLLRQTQTQSKKYPDHQFRIATDFAQFQHLLSDERTIAGLLTVEGAHSFGHYPYNATFKKEWEELALEERLVLRDSFIQNIREVKSAQNGEHAPFFVTFCHHFNNHLAGHARSFSDKSSLFLGLNKPGMRHLFNQEPGLNRGFTPLGEEVLELFLNRQEGRRILIDTKHMSLNTRQAFYRIIRKKREEENDHIPIIHSHAAINGWLSLDQAKSKEDVDALDRGQFFSRWQINLTNEDILETYDSDGIIGVVLHEGRMPGEGFRKQAKKLKKKLKRARRGSANYQRIKQELKDLYLKLVWSTIFHMIKVVRDNRGGANAWKMIALGSDYDGLVDPMDTFPEVDSFQALREDLIAYLAEGKEIFFAQNGEARSIPTAEVSALQFGQSPAEILDAILFGNTNRFLSQYFTTAYLTAQQDPPLVVSTVAA